jgi:hypothetical protein
MAQFQHVAGKTIEVELDLKDRNLLLQAVQAYIDGATHCQACGRPDKDEKRDKINELAILDRLQQVVERRVVEEFNESLELELSSAVDEFNKAFEMAKTCGKFVHYAGGERQIPFAYKDATNALVKRPKLTEDQERGIEKVKELYGTLAVPMPMGIFAFCKKALAGMERWTSWSAGPATSLNAKFGVGLLSPDLEPIRVTPNTK